MENMPKRDVIKKPKIPDNKGLGGFRPKEGERKRHDYCPPKNGGHWYEMADEAANKILKNDKNDACIKKNKDKKINKI